jgi:hypothetical protein
LSRPHPHAREGAAEQQTDNRARRIVRHLDHRGERADIEPPAAARHQRVDVNHRFAAVQLVQNRLIRRIAAPFVSVIGLQIDAVGLERIERVLDFF